MSGPVVAYWHGMLERAPRTVELTVPRARLAPVPGRGAGAAARRAAVDDVGHRGVAHRRALTDSNGGSAA